MEVCGRSKARPIVCNDSPAFQRRHTSARCATESSTYFPCVINTTPRSKIYIRWCCIGPLNAPDFPGIDMLHATSKLQVQLTGPDACHTMRAAYARLAGHGDARFENLTLRGGNGAWTRKNGCGVPRERLAAGADRRTETPFRGIRQA